ncbi:MAG: hypothetical protein GY953_12525, partial [bacterium]|nr:hypothetical protein [bacterium]
GGSPRRITWSGDANHRPRWSPDSRRIAFVSDRSGSSQIWTMDAGGSDPQQITDLATEADGVLYSPDGEHLIFTSEVYPDCPDMACNTERFELEKASPVKARIYGELLYRHWDTWSSNRRTHIFTADLADRSIRDLTPGERNAPPFSLGGPDHYAISPDGKEVCFVMKPDPVPAANTNSELYVVRVTSGEPVRITETPGADNSPLYSPNGTYLAYRSQMRGGYESDRWRLVVMKRNPIEYPAEEEGVEEPPPAAPEEEEDGEAAEEEEKPLWQWDRDSVTILTDGLAKHACDRAQHGVPVLMATIVVDRLEIVDIDKGKMIGLVTVMPGRGETVKGILQETPVPGSGQRVLVGQVHHLAIGLLQVEARPDILLAD